MSTISRELQQWKRLRWAVRATILLVSTVSVATNVLHAQPNPISQAIAAWPPLALLLAIELQSRIPATARMRAAVRIAGTASLAAIAAWMSYWHMQGTVAAYGENRYGSQYLWPLIVDGIMAVTAVSLVELGIKIRSLEDGAVPRPPAAATSATMPVPVSPGKPVELEPAEVLAFREAQQRMRRESRISGLNRAAQQGQD